VSQNTLVIDLQDSGDYQRLLSGDPQTNGMRAGRVLLQPGKSVGQHSTKKQEELLVFLSGQGNMLIGEVGKTQSFPVCKGKVSYIPPQTLHDIQNSGTEPLVYIFCVCPIE
jgi:mannose-6-phosphate isomerase-like protein (cupin superfamily)